MAFMYLTLRVLVWWSLISQERQSLFKRSRLSQNQITPCLVYTFMMSKPLPVPRLLQPSPLGELEITDLNRVYLDAGELSVEVMGWGTAWLDMGRHDSLASATDFVKVIERGQGLKIACLEEIGLYKHWLSLDGLEQSAQMHGSSTYGKYLSGLCTIK